MASLLGRFRRSLWSFKEAPWTLQRLCELLLEPGRQYNKLGKLVGDAAGCSCRLWRASHVASRQRGGAALRCAAAHCWVHARPFVGVGAAHRPARVA